MSSTNTGRTTTSRDFVQQGWQDHAADAAGVMGRLPEGVLLVEVADEVAPLAALIVHVAGEHLGRWADGLGLLERLASRPACAPGSAAAEALARSRAVLHLCAGEHAACEAALQEGHPAELPEASTRARVLATAASALAGQKRLPEATAAFREAAALIEYGPTPEDPATRALAITGNNLACELEETPGRTPEQDALLELAARTARACWERCGTWVNVYLAEYRLAMTCLALGRPQEALAHARSALELCERHQGSPYDLLFAHEALARAHHAAGDAAGAQAAAAQAADCLEGVEEGSRGHARETLDRLQTLLDGRQPAG